MVREPSDGHGGRLGPPADHARLVREIVAAQTGLDAAALTEDAGLRAGTWTSLQHLSVLIVVADTFDFDLNPRLVRDLTTVREMVRHVGYESAAGAQPAGSPGELTYDRGGHG